MREKITQLLEALEINQREFSETIGVSTSAISNLMIGKSQTLSADALRRIRQEYSVNLNWLAGDDKRPMFS